MEKLRNFAILSESVNSEIGEIAANTDTLEALTRNINETTERINSNMPRFISMNVQFDNENKLFPLL